MNLLQKIAAAAAKKMILDQLVQGASPAIKPFIEQLCADSTTVSVLHAHTRAYPQQPITAEQVADMDLSDLSKSLLLEKTEVLSYLNDFFARFQASR